ncbi:MAG: hypothetical protein KY454_00115 [Actinobacteria bacterium]|nr:hypothetical protein [Actinomycetota bacterium]MBW3648947.1 hypothetical protein [Actinomycetota bacterium]
MNLIDGVGRRGGDFVELSLPAPPPGPVVPDRRSASAVVDARLLFHGFLQ